MKAFGTQVAPVQLPIGEEHEFSGVMDLLSRRAWRYDGRRRDSAFHANRNRIAAQRDVLLLRRIEESEELRRDFVFALVWADHCLECFRPADSDVVVLFKI